MNGVLKNTLWALGFILACALAVGIRLDHVHSDTGEWRMRPSAEPLLLRYDGHVYDRDGTGAVKDIGFVIKGKDIGGGTILAPRGAGVPQLIQVRNLHRYYEYKLSS